MPFSEGLRPYRMGLVADVLRERGHEVVWWTSSFNHARKERYFAPGDSTSTLKNGAVVRCVESGTYTRNISLARIRHHRMMARRMRAYWNDEPGPDIVIAALPTIELVQETQEFASKVQIPYMIDVRDLWPDVFWDKAPSPLKPFVKFVCRRTRARVTQALRGASSRIAVSPGYLRWAQQPVGIEAQKSFDRVFPLGHPGFDTVPSRPPESITAKLTGKFVATFAGTFGHSYDLELLGRAAERFYETGIECAIVLIGDGVKLKPLQSRFGHLPNLLFTGWLDNSQLQAILKVSQVGLVPCLSLPNTLPNKPFEYFAAGLPVLSSLSGDMERMLESDGTGFSYRAKDLNGFIAKLEILRTNEKLRAEMAARAFSAFQAKFSAAVIYSEYANLIEAIASKGTPTRMA